MTSPNGPEQELAAWAASLKWADIPAATRQFVTEFVTDSIACMLAGLSVTEVTAVRRAALALAGPGDAAVVGGGTASALAATLINGYLMTAATVCDVHRPTQCHLGPGTVAPALAIAEAGRHGGEQTLTAIAAGLEVATRVGMALRPPVPRSRGWHAPGVLGPFGGAVAAGRLLGLAEPGLVTAMSLAASQAAGTYAQWGTPAVKFHQAGGAGAGLTAALMAAHGFPASGTFFCNADGGFLRVYSDGGDSQALTAGLGSRYALEGISLRRWPGASLVQSILTGLFELLDKQATLTAGTVRRLRIGLALQAYAMHGEMGWSRPFNARISARYIGAVVLVDRQCWLEQFTDQRIADPEVNRVAQTVVTAHADAQVRDAGVRITADLDSGERVEVAVDVPAGDPARRLSPAALREKFLAAAGPVLGGRAAGLADRLLAGPDWEAAEVMSILRDGGRS